MRRTIVEVARALFAEHGIDGVSMRAIARRGGWSPRLPYRYFSSKEDILRAIWHDCFTAAFAGCAAAVQPVRGARPRLEAYLRAYAGYWLDHPDQFEMIFLRKDPIVTSEDRTYVEQYDVVGQFALLGDLVARCIDAGELAVDDPELHEQVLVASLHGVLHGVIVIGEFPWRPVGELVDAWLALALPRPPTGTVG